MTAEEHIAEAERLMTVAKGILKEGDINNNPAAEKTMLDLMSFARLHAEIAVAMGVNRGG